MPRQPECHWSPAAVSLGVRRPPARGKLRAGASMDAKTLLIAAMVTLTVVFLVRWFVVARGPARRRRARRTRAGAADAAATLRSAPSPTSSTRWASGRMRPRRRCSGPGGWCPTSSSPVRSTSATSLPTVVQAVIYMTIVQVEFTTLALMLAAAAGRRLVRCRHRRRHAAPHRAGGDGLGAVRRRRHHAAATARVWCPAAASPWASAAGSWRSASASTSCSAR